MLGAHALGASVTDLSDSIVSRLSLECSKLMVVQFFGGFSEILQVSREQSSMKQMEELLEQVQLLKDKIGLTYDTSASLKWLAQRRDGNRLRAALRSAISKLIESPSDITSAQLNDALHQLEVFPDADVFKVDIADAKAAIDKYVVAFQQLLTL